MCITAREFSHRYMQNRFQASPGLDARLSAVHDATIIASRQTSLAIKDVHKTLKQVSGRRYFIQAYKASVSYECMHVHERLKARDRLLMLSFTQSE